MSRVFLDANIFISFLDDTRKNYKNANSLLEKLYDNQNITQYFCALENGCDKIYTDDTSSFPKLKLPLFGSDDKPFYMAN